jgi:hypothetical protein
MGARRVSLRMWGGAAEGSDLEWSWVEEQLAAAGTYWVVPRAAGHSAPHPRPVWGVWVDDALLLSVGSPVVAREIAQEQDVTVHLDSGTDVVILEGRAAVAPDDATVASFVAAYDPKYDWSYDVAEYGPPTRVEPTAVFGWRSTGWAGRDGVREVGKWTFD